MLVFGNLMRERYHGKFYAKVQSYRPVLTAKYDAALAEYDALVMPSTPMKAHRLDERAGARFASGCGASAKPGESGRPA